MSKFEDFDAQRMTELNSLGQGLEDGFRVLDLVEHARVRGQLSLHDLRVGDFLGVDLHCEVGTGETDRTIVGQLIDQENATFEVLEDTSTAVSLLGININLGCRAENSLDPDCGYKQTWWNLLIPRTWVIIDSTGSNFATGSKEYMDAQYAGIYINGIEVFSHGGKA